MNPLTYATTSAGTNWSDDLSILWRIGRQKLVTSPSQALQIRRFYGKAGMRKILLMLPLELYHLTRLFIEVARCYLAQRAGAILRIRATKFEVNRKAIALAYHSVETNVYLTGWIRPIEGLAGQALHRLAHRLITSTNEYCCRRFGFPLVESREEPPINFDAFRSMLHTHARRIICYVKLFFASVLILIANTLGREVWRRHLRRTIDEGVSLLRHELDVPRYQLAMAFPWLGGRDADAVAQAAHKVVCWCVDLGMDGLSGRQIVQKVTRAGFNAVLREPVYTAKTLWTVAKASGSLARVILDKWLMARKAARASQVGLVHHSKAEFRPG